jgi:ABC-type sugar transport system ATPase subunit
MPSLELIGMKHVINPKKENKLAAEMAGQINIKWAGPDAPADSLSGGNQQKLLIARWLLAKSKFIIFDEPTRGIDIGAKKEVYTLLNRLAQQAKAILLISSELPELIGVTDRILVMRRRKLVGNLETSKTTQEEIMHLAAVEETK